MGGFFVLDSASMLFLDFNEQNIWKLQVTQEWGKQVMKLWSEKVQTVSHGNQEQLRVPTVLFKKKMQIFLYLIQSLAWKFQHTTLKPHSGLVMLTAARVELGGFTSLPCCISWMVGDCYRVEMPLQAEDDKLSQQVRVCSGRNECRGLWDMSQNACEKQKSWQDCHRMDFINAMVYVFWALWSFFFCFFDALSKYSLNSVKMAFFWVGAKKPAEQNILLDCCPWSRQNSSAFQSRVILITWRIFQLLVGFLLLDRSRYKTIPAPTAAALVCKTGRLFSISNSFNPCPFWVLWIIYFQTLIL